MVWYGMASAAKAPSSPQLVTSTVADAISAKALMRATLERDTHTTIKAIPIIDKVRSRDPESRVPELPRF